jgi:sulfonate transport system permease protein
MTPVQRRILLGVLGAALLAAAWQVLGARGSLGRSVPPLTDIARRGWEDRELLIRAGRATMSRSALGYMVGVAAASFVAFGLLFVPRAEAGVHRLAVVVNAVPVIALGPLVQVTALRSSTPVIFAVMAVFFTTLVAVSTGLRAGSAACHSVFSALGASRWQRFRRLQLPAAVPAIADGLKVAAPAALLGSVLGEWYGAERGLGVLLINAMRNFQVDLLWAAAFASVALSAGTYALLSIAESRAVERFSRTVEVKGVFGVAHDVRSRTRRFVAAPVQLWAVALVVLAWQAWITLDDVDRIVAPAPGDVFAYIAQHPGDYLGDALSTLQSAVGGLALGMILGILLAVLASFSPLLSGLVAPLSLLMPSIPIVVIIPVVARILGYSPSTVLVVAVLMAFFPVFVLAMSGLQYRPAGSDSLFSVYGAGRLTRLRRLELASAVPNLLIALRISAASCFLGALTAEWLMGTSGLGHTFSESRALLQPERAWGAIVVAVVLSVCAFLGAGWIEKQGRERWS